MKTKVTNFSIGVIKTSKPTREAETNISEKENNCIEFLGQRARLPTYT